MIEKSVGEEGHNHQEKYFQFYENKRWLSAQTVPLCVELPKDFHFLLPIMPILHRQFFSIELHILSVFCQIQRRQHGFGRKWVSVGKWVSMIFLADPLEISILMKWKKN